MMQSKKIAIIGKGTAGSLAASSFSFNTPSEIVWYHDPSNPAQSVGEGSTLPLPLTLSSDLDFNYTSLKEIDGTFKHGIRKINWGGSGDFVHPFPLEASGIHFNASKLQNYITNHLKNKVKIIESRITSHENIDADYIVDCSGKPLNYKEYNKIDAIPVNASYITPCYWDFPRFDYTLTIARPYGWVFGIPLQNRCSIGYMYNSNINTLEEVKEDVKEVFKQFNLTPGEESKNISFENYYRKENFTDRVAYNGNASSFLEPLEATTIGTTIWNNQTAKGIVYGDISPEEANTDFLDHLKDVQNMIMIHYLAGSKFNTKFWEYASTKAEECLRDNINFKFLNMYKKSKFYYFQNRLNIYPNESLKEVGQWPISSYNVNFKEMDLYGKLENIINTKKWL